MTLVKLINQHISVFSSITWGQPHPWCYRCNLTHVEPWDQPWLCPSCPVALLLPGGTSKPPLPKRWTHLGIYAGTLDSGSNGHILSRHHLDLGRQEAKTWGEGALCQGSRDLGLGSPAPQFSHMTNGLPLPPPRACWRSVMLIASSSWSELIKCHSIQLLSASSNASAEPGGLGTSSPAPQSLEPGSPSRASELRFPDCNLQEMAGTAGCQQATAPRPPAKAKIPVKENQGVAAKLLLLLVTALHLSHPWLSSPSLTHDSRTPGKCTGQALAPRSATPHGCCSCSPAAQLQLSKQALRP